MRQLPLIFIVLAAGCLKGKDTGNVDSAESAVDSSESVQSEGDVMMAAVDGADASGVAPATSDQVAARIAANVAGRWSPASCATVTQTGSDITVKYDDCTGPRGLVHVTGELDLTVSVSLGGVISVHGAATDLQVNRATLTIDTDATYGVSGTDHMLTVTTTGSGTGPLGSDIEHQGDYTLMWDTTSQCGSIMGHWATELTSNVQSAQRSNDVDLSRCNGGCPTGTVTHHFLAGASVTVTFDGTATATWTSSAGKTGTVNLACQ